MSIHTIQMKMIQSGLLPPFVPLFLARTSASPSPSSLSSTSQKKDFKELNRMEARDDQNESVCLHLFTVHHITIMMLHQERKGEGCSMNKRIEFPRLLFLLSLESKKEVCKRFTHANAIRKERGIEKEKRSSLLDDDGSNHSLSVSIYTSLWHLKR